MATVTVPGGTGQAPTTYTYSSSAGLTVAQQIANALGAASIGGTLTQSTSTSGAISTPTPTTAGGASDVIITGSGPTTVTAGSGTGGNYATYTGTSPANITIGAGVQLVAGTVGGSFDATGANALIGAFGGNNTMVAAASGDSIGGGGGTNLYLASGANDSINSAGVRDTVSAGISGNGDTVNVTGSSNDLIFGGPGSMIVGGFGSNETVSAGAGAATIFGGTSGTYFYNNSAAPTFVDEGGANTVVGGTAQVTLFGASGGGSITFSTQGSNPGGAVLSSAGIGNETLNAAGSAGPITAWGGTTGSELFVGGSGNDTLIAGGGSDTFTGGAGANYFTQVMSHATGGSLTITDFSATDTFGLYGYGTAAEQAAVSAATGSVISLADGTTITFSGVKVSAITSQIKIG
jgi:Ca2+-binding RTX toxin-like protein